MPRDMFGSVVNPSIAIGSRKWYTVPVSLMSHAAIVIALVAIPILVPSAMPRPEGRVIIKLDPPAPPDPPRPKQTPAPNHETPSNPGAAPTVMPTEIAPERFPPVEADGPDLSGLIVGDPGPAVDAPPAPRPAPPADPIRVGGTIRPPVKIAGANPVYPQLAQMARKEGLVIIEATIATDGHVMNARILRAEPLLDQAALDAVRSWQYTPTLLNGIPVAVIMTVVVQFHLQ